MKKKKLKQRIAELESQLGTAKSRAEAWEHISHCFIDGLKEHGVKTEIIFPKPPLVDVSRTEDDVAKYAHGINTAPPTLSFDFVEHDRKVLQKENGDKILGYEEYFCYENGELIKKKEPVFGKEEIK